MFVYADNAATTSVSKTALEAMLPYLTEDYGNPSSLYAFGQRAKEGLEKAREDDRKLIAFSAAMSLGVSALMALSAPLLPQLYNTTEGVRGLAVKLLLAGAALMPMHAYANACYFTLRSGGKTLITFVFDSLFTWLVSIPAAFVLSPCRSCRCT